MTSNSLAASEMDTINVEIRDTASTIRQIEKKIAEVESALQGGGTYLGISDPQQLLERLRAHEKRLGALEKKEEQLREEKLRLLHAPSSLAAPEHPVLQSLVASVQRMEEDLSTIKGDQSLVASMQRMEEDLSTIKGDQMQRMQEDLSTIKGDLEGERSVSVSKITTWEKCQKYWMDPLSLQMTTLDAPDLSGTGISPVRGWKAFDWKGESEIAAKPRYLKYFRNLFDVGEQLSIVDCTTKTDMLTINAGELLLNKISGTSDIAICRVSAVKMNLESTGIRVLVEVKPSGKVDGGATCQAATQLVLANLHAPLLKPFVTLTDFQNDWRLLFIRDKRVVVWGLEGPSAVAVLRFVLRRECVDEVTGGVISSGHSEVKGGLRDLLERTTLSKTTVFRETGEDAASRLRDLQEFGLEVDEEIQREEMAAAVRKVMSIPCFAPYQSMYV